MEADIDFPEKGKKKVGFKIEDTSTADLYCHHEGCKNKFDLKWIHQHLQVEKH